MSCRHCAFVSALPVVALLALLPGLTPEAHAEPNAGPARSSALGSRSIDARAASSRRAFGRTDAEFAAREALPLSLLSGEGAARLLAAPALGSAGAALDEMAAAPRASGEEPGLGLIAARQDRVDDSESEGEDEDHVASARRTPQSPQVRRERRRLLAELRPWLATLEPCFKGRPVSEALPEHLLMRVSVEEGGVVAGHAAGAGLSEEVRACMDRTASRWRVAPRSAPLSAGFQLVRRVVADSTDEAPGAPLARR
jgi:hypothetical protein